MRILAPTLLVAFLFGTSARGAEIVPEDLAGLWAGPAHHGQQESTIALRLAPAGGDTLAVMLSLLALDVRDLGLGRATLRGDTLRLGPWDLYVEEDARTIRGVLPSFLVPLYEISFVLTPVDSLPRPDPPPSPPSPEPVWTYQTGSSVWAAVAVAGERVLGGSDDGRVYAVDARNGTGIWSFETGGAIRARPTVHDGLVLVHSDDEVLYALDADSGIERWRTPLGERKRTRIPPGTSGSRYDVYASAPVVVDGRIYVGDSAGRMHALDLTSGREIWRFEAADTIASTPAVGGGRVCFGSFDGRIRAVDAETGTLLWTQDAGGAVPSSPALVEDEVVVGSRSYDLLVLDAATGALRWKHYVWFSWVESSATARGSTAYVGSSDAQQLLALDLRDRALAWSVDTGGSAWAQPAVTSDAVFVGTVGVADYFVPHRGCFLAVDRTTGEVRWRYTVPRPDQNKIWGFASSPAVSTDRVFVGGLDGRLYAFDQRPFR